MFISVYSNGCLLIFTHNWTHVDMKFISHNGTITSQNSDISYWITLYITNYQIKFFLLKQAPNYEELSGRWGVAPAILGVGQRTVSLVCLLMPEKDSPPSPLPILLRNVYDAIPNRADFHETCSHNQQHATEFCETDTVSANQETSYFPRGPKFSTAFTKFHNVTLPRV